MLNLRARTSGGQRTKELKEQTNADILRPHELDYSQCNIYAVLLSIDKFQNGGVKRFGADVVTSCG